MWIIVLNWLGYEILLGIDYVSVVLLYYIMSMVVL